MSHAALAADRRLSAFTVSLVDEKSPKSKKEDRSSVLLLRVSARLWGVVLPSADCELCEAAQITPWFLDDELCWVADCESCDVPMVVWKVHDPSPSDEIKAELHRRLGEVVAQVFEYEHYIDDNLRSIPTHYHAHARPRGRFPARGPVPRKQISE